MIASWIQPKHIGPDGKPKPNSVFSLSKLKQMNTDDAPSVVNISLIRTAAEKSVAQEKACKFCSKRRESRNQVALDKEKCDCENAAKGVRALIATLENFARIRYKNHNNGVSLSFILTNISDDSNPGHCVIHTVPEPPHDKLEDGDYLEIGFLLTEYAFILLRSVQSVFQSIPP